MFAITFAITQMFAMVARGFATEDSPQRRFATQRVRHTTQPPDPNLHDPNSPTPTPRPQPQSPDPTQPPTSTPPPDPPFDYACLRRLRHVVMKKFEIAENFYSPAALLKIAGGRDAFPHPPLYPPLRSTKTCFFCKKNDSFFLTCNTTHDHSRSHNFRNSAKRDMKN